MKGKIGKDEEGGKWGRMEKGENGEGWRRGEMGKDGEGGKWGRMEKGENGNTCCITVILTLYLAHGHAFAEKTFLAF